MENELKTLDELAASYGFIGIYRGISPIKLIYLDDYQYIQDCIKQEIIVTTDVRTFTEAKSND